MDSVFVRILQHMARQAVAMTKLTDYTPDPRNANAGTERGQYMIDHSLGEYGAGRSILVDGDNVIIAGNKTHAAAVDAGMKVKEVITDGNTLVVVKRSDLSLDSDDGKARLLAYADNRAGEVGLDWDADVILADLEAGVDLSGMFRDDELEEIIGDLDDGLGDGEDAEAQVSRADELAIEWGTELGQVWRLATRSGKGEHRVTCGDCTDAGVVEVVMGGDKADIMISSPPYNSASGVMKYDYYGKANSFYLDKSMDKKTESEWVGMCDDVFNAYENISTDKDSTIVWNVMYNANARASYGKHIFGDGHNYEVKETISWDKGHGFNIATKGILSRRWELVFVMSNGEDYQTSQRENEARFNRWDIPTGGTQIVDTHNAAYPVAFPEKALDWFSFKASKCYDPFLGSGTTLIACENLARLCRGVEISPAYVAVALQHYQDAFGITAELVAT